MDFQSLQPKVAIVVLNYKTPALLERFLPSVLSTTYKNAEVIVADNASPDHSVAFMKENFPDVRLIEMEVNTGYAGGYNECLKEVEADYYVLLNSDVEVDAGWIEPMVDLATRDPKIAAIQPKLRDAKKKSHFEYAGANGGFLDRYGYPFCRGRIFGELEEDMGQYDDPREIFWACGAALFIKADLFHEMNGFDLHFFAHMEEIDLCWRLKNRGYEIWSQPRSVVYHVGGGTLEEGSQMKYYLNFRNNLALITKNHPSPFVLVVIFFRLILDGLSGLKFLAEGRASMIFQIIKAHWHYFLKMPHWFKERRRLKKAANSKAVLYPKSIVFQHYLFKKKKFSDLI